MNYVFWISWIIDLLLLLLVISGSAFRTSFGASTGFNQVMTVVLLTILVAAFIAKTYMKNKWISLAIVMLPLIGMLLMYLLEDKT